MANRVDPDQTAPWEALWSGSKLFAKTCLSKNKDHYVLNTSPLRNICICYCYRWDMPGAIIRAAGQSSEVKLTTNLWIGAARVWDVVRVERHQMTEHV